MDQRRLEVELIKHENSVRLSKGRDRNRDEVNIRGKIDNESQRNQRRREDNAEREVNAERGREDTVPMERRRGSRWDDEKTAKNLVIYNMIESEEVEVENRIADNEAILNNMLTYLGVVGVEVIKVNRLGQKREPDYPRPLLVRISNEHDKWAVLSKAKFLKDLDDFYAIYMAKDMSKYELNEDQKTKRANGKKTKRGECYDKKRLNNSEKKWNSGGKLIQSINPDEKRNNHGGIEENISGYSEKNKRTNGDDNFFIKYINVQGLNDMKMLELAQYSKHNNEIVLLTETHLRYNKIKERKDIVRIDQMRIDNDEKGGGLCVLYNKSIDAVISKVENKNKDILNLNREGKQFKLNILLVYLAVQNTKLDKERNVIIKKGIEAVLNKTSGPTWLIGDFNGHIKGLGYQREDVNGRLVLDLEGRYRMNILNLDERYKGKFTWERNDQKSVIDFALVNEDFYQITKIITIDDDKNLFDLSDHNMMEITMKKDKHREKWRKSYKNIEYISYKEEHMIEFTQGMEAKME